MSKIEPKSEKSEKREQEHVAIVGMSCIFPGAPDLSSFWSNLVAGRSAIADAGDGQWDAAKYFNSESSDFERFYCKAGGFISEYAEFDPLEHGIMPKAVSGADPDQFLALKSAREAIRDAGYLEPSKNYNREKASVILGRTSAPGVGALNLIQHGQTVDQIIDVVGSAHPQLSVEQLSSIRAELKASLSPCNADTIPGVMPNIIAGRVASSLGWSGKTLILDAACASSLVAVELGIDDLRSRRSDIVLAGGIHVNSSPYFFQMFCGISALSPTGEIRPFDANANGTLLGEGVGWVVIKRLDDAVAAGDRIYAVIRGVGTSSNGTGTSVLAPSVDGEVLAMRRAFEAAGVSPATVGLLEGHGTATRSGDDTELAAIEKVFGSNNSADRKSLSQAILAAPGQPWCALGSVKSNIGHAQAASGMAGLIKVALALHQKVIPPTLNISKPTSKVDWKSFPCYLNVRAKPWIHPFINPALSSRKLTRQFLAGAASRGDGSGSSPTGAEEQEKTESATFPRRAAVSAFGFGGINAHAVLEEYLDADESLQPNLLQSWDSELFILEAGSQAQLLERIDEVLHLIAQGCANSSAQKPFTLSRLAYSVNKQSSLWNESTNLAIDRKNVRLAIVAGSLEELATKLASSHNLLTSNLAQQEIDYRTTRHEGIYLSSGNERTALEGKIAFVLPGLGAAYPGMLSGLCYNFPEVREVFDFVDRLAINVDDATLPSSMVFPGSAISVSSTIALAQSHSAVVTVLMAEWALFVLLKNLGVEADTVLGCSTGEFAAMAISGAVDIVTVAEIFYHMSAATARAIPQDRVKELRSLQITSAYAALATLFDELDGPVYLSAELSNDQSIVTGDKAVIEKATALLEGAGVRFAQLPVAIPYHTPLVADALNADDEKEFIRTYPLTLPQMKVWSCSTGTTFPDNTDALRKLASQLFKHPVLFAQTIEAMYQDGVRVFIELGPKGGLTSSVGKVLENRPHLALAADLPKRTSICQLNHLLATLACHGKTIKLEHLSRRRGLEPAAHGSEKSKTTVKLSLTYPEIKPGAMIAALAAAPVSQGQTQNPLNEPSYEDASQSSVPQPSEVQVVSSYLDVTSEFHNQMVAVQRSIMRAYLADADLSDGDK